MSKAVQVLPIGTAEHLDAVNQFLIKHFFSREPLGLRLGINPEKDTREWISQVTTPLIGQNVSIILFRQILQNPDLILEIRYLHY